MLFQTANSPSHTLIGSNPFEIMILKFFRKKNYCQIGIGGYNANKGGREAQRKEGAKLTTNTQETSKNGLRCSLNLRKFHFGLSSKLESKAEVLIQEAVCSFFLIYLSFSHP